MSVYYRWLLFGLGVVICLVSLREILWLLVVFCVLAILTLPHVADIGVLAWEPKYQLQYLPGRLGVSVVQLLLCLEFVPAEYGPNVLGSISGWSLILISRWLYLRNVLCP